MTMKTIQITEEEYLLLQKMVKFLADTVMVNEKIHLKALIELLEDTPKKQLLKTLNDYGLISGFRNQRIIRLLAKQDYSFENLKGE